MGRLRALLVLAILAAAAPTAGVATAGPQARDAADPLLGTWDTAPLPLAKYRAALQSHGYSDRSIDKLFGSLALHNHIEKTIEYEISYSPTPDGTHFQIVRFWDPTTGPKPPDSTFDHGPYELLPGDRVQSTGTDPPTNTWRTTFRYAIHGKQLTLRFVSLIEPGVNPTQLNADRKKPIIQAAGIYTRTGP
jgi:hypothetical protein